MPFVGGAGLVSRSLRIVRKNDSRAASLAVACEAQLPTDLHRPLSFFANKLSLKRHWGMTTVLYATQNTCWAVAADAILLCRRAMLGFSGVVGDYASDLLGACGRLIDSCRARPAPQIRMQPAPLGIEGQWQRATGIIRAALASFRNIQTFQAAAARQIDAADYALQLLIQDLGAAMPIPADGRALRAVLAEAAKTVPAPRKKSLAA